jgi:hypothetical protein
VDLVVQAFGEREKLGVAGDHEPADRDVEIADVPNQHLQHLSDPAAGSGRVDVPYGAPGQLSPNPVSGLEQAKVPLATDEGLQQRDRPPWHFRHLDQAHGIPLRSDVAGSPPATPRAPAPNVTAYPYDASPQRHLPTQ